MLDDEFVMPEAIVSRTLGDAIRSSVDRAVSEMRGDSACVHSQLRNREVGIITSVRDRKPWQVQEAAQIIPTLNQQRSDVVGACADERRRAIICQRRRCPSSDGDSQLWQRRAKSPHQISCFRGRAGWEISKAHDRELSVSHQRRQLHGLHASTGDLQNDRQTVHQICQHRERHFIGESGDRVAQYTQRLARFQGRWMGDRGWGLRLLLAANRVGRVRDQLPGGFDDRRFLLG